MKYKKYIGWNNVSVQGRNEGREGGRKEGRKKGRKKKK